LNIFGLLVLGAMPGATFDFSAPSPWKPVGGLPFLPILNAIKMILGGLSRNGRQVLHKAEKLAPHAV
jgi:hypothetical protein